MPGLDYTLWPSRVWNITSRTGNHHLGSTTLPLRVIFISTATGVRVSLSSAPNWHNRTASSTGTARDAVEGPFIASHEFDITSVGSQLVCSVRDLRPRGPGRHQVDATHTGGTVVGGWTAEDGSQTTPEPPDPPED